MNATAVKYGRDDDLEKQANEILAASVGDNTRSIRRDVEKMSYERGRVSGDLEFYDPANDWDTLDSAFSILTDDVTSDRGVIEPSICDGLDGNVRAKNERLRKRRDLMKHVKDSDGWGSPEEVIPFLGDNGDRKRCARCGRSKVLDCFSPDSRGRCGRDNWCKMCRMGQKRAKRKEKADG